MIKMNTIFTCSCPCPSWSLWVYVLFSEMRMKLFKVIRSECDRQLFSCVDTVKYGYANSISTLFLSFFERMSTSTVDIDCRPIFFV